MGQLETKVLETIKRRSLLKGGEKVLVGLSGGPDSVALIYVLSALHSELGLRLSAAHINYKLRGRDSDKDQGFVESLCENLGLTLYLKVFPLDSSDKNLEERGREVRYDFLAKTAFSEKAIVATAHTQDDQAETFLMKLARGSGSAGLSGIHADRRHTLSEAGEIVTVQVIRPFIDVGKEEILKYLRGRKLGFREDHSNLDASFDRNWVRHELIPQLEKRLNPRLSPTLARTAHLIAETEDYLETQTEDLVKRVCRLDESGSTIQIDSITDIHPIMQKRVVRRAFQHVTGTLKGLTLGQVEDVIDLIDKQSGMGVHLPFGLQARREFNQIRLSFPKPGQDFQYALELPGRIDILEVGKSLESIEVEPCEGALRLTDGSVTVRNRRSGDRFRNGPKGKNKKLKKHFLEKRIPLHIRDQLIVVEYQGQVVWVEGISQPITEIIRRKSMRGNDIDRFFIIKSETFRPLSTSNTVTREEE